MGNYVNYIKLEYTSIALRYDFDLINYVSFCKFSKCVRITNSALNFIFCLKRIQIVNTPVLAFAFYQAITKELNATLTFNILEVLLKM